MQDISLHILDIVENSVNAGASLIEVTLDEDLKNNRLSLTIKDNGRGIEKKYLKSILDPFYTTKKGSRIGLGLPLLAQAAKEAGGELKITSSVGTGTEIAAVFIHDHIDRKPLGDISETLIDLVAAKGLKLDIIYSHNKNGDSFIFDTREIKKELQDVNIDNPEVLKFLKKRIKESLNEIKVKGD